VIALTGALISFGDLPKPAIGTAVPQNCWCCKYMADPDGGWCYMFREMPADKCAQFRVDFSRAAVRNPEAS